MKVCTVYDSGNVFVLGLIFASGNMSTKTLHCILNNLPMITELRFSGSEDSASIMQFRMNEQVFRVKKDYEWFQIMAENSTFKSPEFELLERNLSDHQTSFLRGLYIYFDDKIILRMINEQPQYRGLV